MTLTKLEQRELKIRKQIHQALKSIDLKTIGTRELLDYAMRNAILYKYQKTLLLVETFAKLDNGEYN